MTNFQSVEEINALTCYSDRISLFYSVKNIYFNNNGLVCKKGLSRPSTSAQMSF